MDGEVAFKLLNQHDRIERVMRVVSEEEDTSAAAKKLGISATLLDFYTQAGRTVPEVREMLRGYVPKLPFEAAVELGTVKPDNQLKLAEEIVARGLSGEKAIQFIRAAKNGNGASHPPSQKTSPQPESQERHAGGSVAEGKSPATEGKEPDRKDEASNGEGSPDSSEFAAVDSFLKEA